MTQSEQPISRWQVWMLAARPKTLPAAAAGVVTGTALALRDGHFRLGPALAALLVALLLQIGSNLANDVYDYERGADTGERHGPMRVTQAQLLAPAQVKAGMWVVFGLSALLGLYLAFVAGWVVILIGLAAIFSAIAYTGGPFPLGITGWEICSCLSSLVWLPWLERISCRPARSARRPGGCPCQLVG